MHATRYASLAIACLLLFAGGASATTVLSSNQPPPAIVANGSGPDDVKCPTAAEIGRLVFFDTNLSYPTGRSCASCHDPSFGFADPNRFSPTSVGSFNDRFGSRNAPSVAYCSHSPTFHYDPTVGGYVGGQFWDGRSATLSDQARSPFLNPLEMNNFSSVEVVLKVKASSYAGLFKQLYGTNCFDNVEAAYGMISNTLAAFENSSELNPFSSKYDQYLDGTAHLNRQERLGLHIFEGKGGCSGCHPSEPGPGGTPPVFTNHTYHNIGVPRNPDNPYYALSTRFNGRGAAWIDPGLGAVVALADEIGKMKVPTLRNVALTAPYGHNGVFGTLRGVVDFCANRNVNYQLEPEVAENIDTSIFGNAGLRPAEVDAVVAFLNTLSDGYWQRPRKDPGVVPTDLPTPDGGTPSIDAALAMSISPNPFNPATRIGYSLEAQSRVQLAVYDVAGRLVRNLVNGDLPPVNHTATWDGRDMHGATVASGIYFIRLDTGTQKLVRKAVLTR
jgi:cytochrome c peroxidase